MVRPAGIEPAAYSLGGCRSIQLSYERVKAVVGCKYTAVKGFLMLGIELSGNGSMSSECHCHAKDR